MEEQARLTDEEVVKRVQQGDQEIFGVLVRRYEQKMLRYGRRFLFKHVEIEDVIQEIFLKAYINIKSFDTSRRFSPWLYRIAHNEFINAGRRIKLLPVFTFDLDELFPHLSAKEQADDTIKEREIKELVDGHLSALDPKYREPLILYYLEEMSYREIADILKIPIATVGIRLKRGKEALMRMMRDEVRTKR